MNIFGLGLPEIVVILVIALLIFGPKKLPEVGRSMGKAIRSFQEASKEFESEFKRESQQLEASKSEEPAPSEKVASAPSQEETPTSSSQS